MRRGRYLFRKYGLLFISFLIGVITSTFTCFYSCDFSSCPSCSSNSGVQKNSYHPVLVILIFSAVNNMEQRDTIRQTWLKNAQNERNVMYYFVIGSGRLDENEMKTLKSENIRFGDLILLPNVNDSYRNLAKKLMSSLVWLYNKIEFDFLLKVDDDTFVQVKRILSELNSMPNKQLFYWGFFDGRAHVKRQGQWQETEWILCDRYLPYAVGGGYLISHDLVEFIAKNEKYLKLFNSEDVSLGTWLAPLDVRRLHDSRFDTEFRSRGCHNSYLVTHKQSVEQMREKYWNLQDKGRLCQREIQTRYSYDYNWKVPPSQCCIRSNSSIP